MGDSKWWAVCNLVGGSLGWALQGRGLQLLLGRRRGSAAAQDWRLLLHASCFSDMELLAVHSTHALLNR